MGVESDAPTPETSGEPFGMDRSMEFIDRSKKEPWILPNSSNLHASLPNEPWILQVYVHSNYANVIYEASSSSSLVPYFVSFLVGFPLWTGNHGPKERERERVSRITHRGLLRG